MTDPEFIWFANAGEFKLTVAKMDMEIICTKKTQRTHIKQLRYVLQLRLLYGNDNFLMWLNGIVMDGIITQLVMSQNPF